VASLSDLTEAAARRREGGAEGAEVSLLQRRGAEEKEAAEEADAEGGVSGRLPRRR
jgi:hypothetical protein